MKLHSKWIEMGMTEMDMNYIGRLIKTNLGVGPYGEFVQWAEDYEPGLCTFRAAIALEENKHSSLGSHAEVEAARKLLRAAERSCNISFNIYSSANDR